MTRSTYGTLVATCGHEYEGYSDQPVWSRCPTCLRQAQRTMAAENQRRAIALAQPNGRKFKVTAAKRLRIYERDGWVCQLCGLPVDRTLDPHHDLAPSLDHIVCRSWGGNDAETNLRLAHRICNARRGDEGRWLSAWRRIPAS